MAIKIRSVVAKKILATTEFTDRVEPRKAFWDNYEKMKQEGSGILTYYGASGLGKSRLLKELKSEMERKNKTQGCDAYKYASFDFNDLINRSDMNVRDILQSLKAQLMDYGCDFPLFEAGDFYYSIVIGKNVNPSEVKLLIDKYPMLRKLKDKLRSADKTAEDLSSGFSVAASILNVDFNVANDFPGLKEAKKIFGFAERYISTYIERNRELDPEYAETKRKMGEFTKDRGNTNRLYDYLPILFAQDVKDWIVANNEHLVIFLDSYDILVNDTAVERFKRGQDLWLRNEQDDVDNNLGIVLLIPQVLWVIAGRNKIRWGKELGDAMEQHLLEVLSYDDANYFLKTAGVATQELRDGIIKLADGSPSYLDLCVDIYSDYRQQNGKEPTIDDFGQNRSMIVERTIKYMDDGARDMIRSLCALKVWTDEMATKIVPNFNPTVYEEKIKTFSFVQSPTAEESGLPFDVFRFDRTVQSILFDKFSGDGDYLNNEVLHRANEYFSKKLSNTDKNNPIFCFYLEIWADNIVRLTTNPEELKDQYETHLEDLLKSLDWKMYGTKANVVEIFYNRVSEIADFDTIPYAFFEYQYGKIKRNCNEYKVAYDCMKSAYGKFSKQLGDENPYSMKVLYSLAKMADYVGHRIESAELLDKYLEMCKKIIGADNEDTVSIMKDLAYAYSSLKEKDKSLGIYQDIFLIIGKNHEKNDKEYLDAELDVARALKSVGKEAEAASIHKRVFSVLNEKLEGYTKNIDALDENSLMAASAVVDDIGLMLFTTGENFEENLRLEFNIRRGIIRIYKKVLGLENEKTIDAIIDYTESLACGLIDDAYKDEIRGLCEDLLKSGEMLYGKDDERMLRILDRVVFCSEFADLYDMKDAANHEILKFRRDIMADYKDYYGDGDDKTISAMQEVAHQFGIMERKADKLNITEEIFAIRRKYLGDKDEKTLAAMSDLASVFDDMEQYDDELDIQKEILTIRKDISGESACETLNAMEDIAETLNRMERYEDELAVKKDIVTILRQNGNKLDEINIFFLRDLAQTLIEQEKDVEALALLQEIVAFFKKQYGEDADKTIEAKMQLADVMINLKMHDEASSLRAEISESRKINSGAYTLCQHI